MSPEGMPPTCVRVACEQGVATVVQSQQFAIMRGASDEATPQDKASAVAATANLKLFPMYMTKILESKEKPLMAMRNLNHKFMRLHVPWRENLADGKVREMQVVIYPMLVGVAGEGGNGDWSDLQHSIHTIDVEQLRVVQKAGRQMLWCGSVDTVEAALVKSDLFFLYNESLCMAFGRRDEMAQEWVSKAYIYSLLYPTQEKDGDGGHNTLFCACNYAFRYKIGGSDEWIYVDKNML